MGSPEPPMIKCVLWQTTVWQRPMGTPAASASARTTSKAGYRILTHSVAQTFREFQAVGHHAVRRAAGNVDPMSAALHAVGRDCGGTTDTNDGNIFVGQFDGATVSPTRHHLGGFHGCDSARLLTEEIG